MSAPRLRYLATVASTVALGGCLDLTGVGDFGGRLVGIDVSPSNAMVVVGDTVRIAATGDVDGLYALFAYDRLLDAVWTVSDPTVAWVESSPIAVEGDTVTRASARIHGVKIGTVRVKVTARRVSGEATVQVVRGPNDR
jgi:hypothetical protein